MRCSSLFVSENCAARREEERKLNMTYEEARKYLDQVAVKGNVLGLTSMGILLKELGNPQDQLKFVHIAGTNGKGSVMAYVGAALKSAGYRIGRYVSPTLFSYEERIQINGSYISREDVARLVTQIAEARETIAGRGEPSATVFEVETAMSFLYFVEQKCDLVLLETGMGGREDATNLVKTTLVEVLSSISMDHMAFLGDTIAKIAWNKAGIIKKNTLAVSDTQQPEAMEVIRQVCQEQNATLSMVEEGALEQVQYGLKEQSFCYRGIDSLKIHLAGTCQIHNAALAVETLLALRKLGYQISDEQIRDGLGHTVWEGRFQVVHEHPTVVMDGAHNPDAARVLMDAVDHYFEGRKIYYIFGVFSDKEYDKIIKITAARAEKIFTVETKDNPRALPVQELTRAVAAVNPHVETVKDVGRALSIALKEASEEDVILTFGSLSFLWEVKQFFGYE